MRVKIDIGDLVTDTDNDVGIVTSARRDFLGGSTVIQSIDKKNHKFILERRENREDEICVIYFNGSWTWIAEGKLKLISKSLQWE